MAIYALWSSTRSRSTAFFRSMIERGDMVCSHEPFSDLTALGETDVAGRPFTSTGEFMRWLRHDTRDIGVFIKDTPNPRHAPLVEQAWFVEHAHHTFLIRRPEEVAASFYAIEGTASAQSIGLEYVHRLWDLTRQSASVAPLVIDADDLLTRPAQTMAAWCHAAGLAFIEQALRWDSGDRSEWRRSARWHVDVAASDGFHGRVRRYEVTVDNSPQLAEAAAHNRPFYEALYAERLRIG
ncbi:MAG: sulfotransferase family protein [Actinomycetota bacterium]